MHRFLHFVADSTGYAQSYDDVVNKFENPGDNTVANNPVGLINIFLYIGGIAAIVMIIVAGIQMTTSAGDPSAVKKARLTLTWSIIGLAVMVLAYAIVNFVIAKI